MLSDARARVYQRFWSALGLLTLALVFLNCCLGVVDSGRGRLRLLRPCFRRLFC